MTHGLRAGVARSHPPRESGVRAVITVSRAWVLALVLSGWPLDAAAQAVGYRLSFPEREHRIMDVELTVTDLPAGPLQLRMSRSSPGRYATHEFAKNVFDVRVIDASGRRLAVTRPNPHQWDVAGHSGAVRVTYRVFGDRTDGTYLSVDSTHAHINMPAALMWARGLDLRPIQVRFEPPPGVEWQVATQLFPTVEPFTFTAPNLQYAMDSPSEFSAFTSRTFSVADGSRVPTFRLAVHHVGDEGEIESFAQDIEKIVREARRVYGEFAPFDGNAYTFIADYLPWANGDGMEHRNSAVLTSASSIRVDRLDMLDTVAHEFFHSWNVERIRPRGLEPFNLEDTNLSGELWFAEGFTSYYAPLLMRRAGLTNASEFASDMSRAVNAVLTSPGRRIRTAEEMSQHAPFVDAATAIDRTSFDNTYLSYYTWGQAIGLGLDLALRDRAEGRVTLDDVMRAMWQRYGRPGGRVPGYVDNPYTIADLRSVLATVSGDAAFAREFFAQFIQGHDVVDYGRLLSRAGFVVRSVAPAQAFAGNLRFLDGASGLRVTAAVPFGSPAYAAGLERDDVVVFASGAAVMTEQDFRRALTAKRPGDELPIVFERRGERVTTTIRLGENPYLEIVPAEALGQTLTESQRRFRDAWLTSP
jgi:predicted metalloprotease with PDZ domain